MATNQTSSSCKVFGITELLENVLIKLPNKDLLLAQRVCKTWRNTIVGSERIQKALCFKSMGMRSKPILGPLQKSFEGYPIFVPLHLLPPGSAEEFYHQVKNERFALNPLLGLFVRRWSGCYKFTIAPKLFEHICGLNFANTMFLTQPITTSVEFCFNNGAQTWLGHTHTVTNEAGVTLGDIFVEFKEQYPKLRSDQKHFFSLNLSAKV